MSDNTLNGMRVLVVDDVPAISSLVQRLLKRKGAADVAVAADTKSAWDMLERERYDAMLLDYQLKGETGVKLLKRLREDHRARNRDLPTIMLTTHIATGIVQECVKAGSDAYLVKPVSPDRLADRIRRTVALKQERAEEAGAQPTETDPDDLWEID